MTEEITYANLKFENNYELENIRQPEDTEKKGSPTSSHSCWPVVLILFMLCLVLLIALVTLAVMFFQISKDYRMQIRDLNMTRNELHANFSNMLQAIGNQLCLEGEESLKNNGQNCALCPTNWKWEGGKMCYYISERKKSWEQSHQFCSSRNSTLLLVKDKAKLEVVKKFPRNSYWLGLTYRAEQRDWYWVDNTIPTEELNSWARLKYYMEYCRSLDYDRVYARSCEEENNYICEKPAVRLQQSNNHWQEDWIVRPK